MMISQARMIGYYAILYESLDVEDHRCCISYNNNNNMNCLRTNNFDSFFVDSILNELPLKMYKCFEAVLTECLL